MAALVRQCYNNHISSINVLPWRLLSSAQGVINDDAPDHG